MKFHHDGVVSEKLEDDIRIYEKLGYIQEGNFFIDTQQQIRGVFLINGESRIELLEATSDTSPVLAYKKRGVKIYHHCFYCDDIEKTISSLEGFLVSPPKPAIAFENRLIAFILLRNNLLIELVQNGEA